MGKTRSTRESKAAAGTTIEGVKSTLRQLIQENAGIPADSIREDSSIETDLAMDSFSLLSLQVAVEETFEVTFELSDIEACHRFDAMAELIHERIETSADTAPPPSPQGAKKRAKTSPAKGS